MTVEPRPRRFALGRGDRKLLRDVRTHGWHVLKVLGENRVADWAFSVALFSRFHHPEIVVFGLPLDRMHALINVTGELVRSGQGLSGASRSYDILANENLPVEFREIEPAWYKPLLGYALWYYRSSSFPALQLFWPDRQGRFPWETEFEPSLRPYQPLLYESDPAKAGTTELLAKL